MFKEMTGIRMGRKWFLAFSNDFFYRFILGVFTSFLSTGAFLLDFFGFSVSTVLLRFETKPQRNVGSTSPFEHEYISGVRYIWKGV